MGRERNVRIRMLIKELTDQQTKQVQIFKPDPLCYLMTEKQDLNYKNQLCLDLLQLTGLLNFDLWRVVTDILFTQHSEVLYSILFQLIPSYDRRYLPLLTKSTVEYQDMLYIANLFQINILLFKPTFLPFVLKPTYRFYNMFIHNMQDEKTLLIYSRPIEHLLIIARPDVQLRTVTYIGSEERMKGFFDMNQCIIRIKDYDRPKDMKEFLFISEEEQASWYSTFYQRFLALQRDGSYPAYKIWIAIWCDMINPSEIPVQWDALNGNTIYLKDLILFLVKVALTFSGMGVLIFKGDYYCICNDKKCLELTVCELDENTHQLRVPFSSLTRDCLSSYTRKPLKSLLERYPNFEV